MVAGENDGGMMFIESFRVQGFKSLRDVSLENLQAINVFHGDNNAGKSNILQAIDLFFQLLPTAIHSLGEGRLLLPYQSLEPYSVSVFCQPSETKEIVWQARMKIHDTVFPLAIRLEERRNLAAGRDELFLEWVSEPEEAIRPTLVNLELPENDFNLVPASRRLRDETLSVSAAESDLVLRRRGSPVEAHNLKQTLATALFGENLDDRARFRRLSHLLNDLFSVGDLDVALLADRKILARFLPNGSKFGIGLEDMGSGVQQMVLLLGQILLNPARLVGLEEPEMNLHGFKQDRLRAIFPKLIAPDGVNQLFIASHSTRFEFHEKFYQVSMVNGETVVDQWVSREAAKATGQSPEEQIGEQTLYRLNSLNQVTLDPEIIRDAKLQRGDIVFFRKNLDGRWELWHDDEVAKDLREALDDSTNSE